MGYARSKWVTEALCKIVSETTPVRAVVLRESFRDSRAFDVSPTPPKITGIGQMVGSTVDGRWNESEAISLQLRTGDVLGALPDLKEVS